MSTLKISEAGTVQFPMVRHVEEIGWTPLTPYEALASRGGEAGAFLRDVLEAKLAEVANAYSGRGVATVWISSNDVENYPADAPENLAEQARRVGASFPYLYDASQEVAKAFKAMCTPDLYLFDAEHKLFYRGRFDATRPEKGEPTGEDLVAALEALLAGEQPPEPQWPSMGCNIKWRPGSEPEYFG